MKVFIRTVTYHYVGDVQLVDVKLMGMGDFVMMNPAWWVAESGKPWNERVKSGDFEDAQLCDGPLYINVDSIVDWQPTPHLPDDSLKK